MARDYKISVMILLPMLIFFTRAARMVNMREGFLVLLEWSVLITPAVTKNFQLSLIFLNFMVVSYQIYQIDFQNPVTYFTYNLLLFTKFYCIFIWFWIEANQNIFHRSRDIHLHHHHFAPLQKWWNVVSSFNIKIPYINQVVRGNRLINL